MAARTFDGYASCFAKFATSHGCQTRARPPLAAVRQRAADVFCVITARTHDPRQTTSPVCRSFSTTAAGPVELAHSAVEDSRIGESRKDRHPKKKAALVVAYDGSYFVGSQYLPYAPSVDGALVHAMIRAGVVDPSHTSEFEKLLWSRASRTDRGVHATCNIVTAKVRIDSDWYESTRHSNALADAINAHLPPYIRVLSAVHVPSTFNAHHDAVSRVYHYFLPASILRGGVGGDSDGKAEAAKLAQLNGILGSFVGTHAFHNFTLPRVRAATVHPAHPHLWQHLGIHPSSGLQPARTAVAPSTVMCDSDVGGGEPVAIAAECADGEVDTLTDRHEDGDGAYLKDRAMTDNVFTRLYDALYGTGAGYRLGAGDAETVGGIGGGRGSEEGSELSDATVLSHRDFAKWKFDLSCMRTIYSCTASAPMLSLPPSGINGEVVLDNWHVAPSSTATTRVPTPTTRSTAATTATSPQSGVAGEAPSSFIRITVHGSSFQVHQIRFMVGTALAILTGKLPPNYINIALVVPYLHRLPLAPPWGLVQGEVHFNTRANVALTHPDGTPDTATPIVSIAMREARLSDPRHLDPLTAATDSPDIALLLQRQRQARVEFFTVHIWPRLLQFMGDRPLTAISSDVAMKLLDASTNARSNSGAQAGGTLAFEPSTAELSPALSTFQSWLNALDSEIPSPRVLAAASVMYEHMSVQKAAIALKKVETFQSAQRDVASKMWAREGKVAPLEMERPLHIGANGQRVASGSSTTPSNDAKIRKDVAARLRQFRLAEIRKLLLPHSLVTQVAIASGITSHRVLAHITRALCWRISQAEWPIVATAEQHAAWVVATQPAVLVKEGKLLYWMERAEARNMSGHEYYMRKMAKQGRDVVDEWGHFPAPLLPLTELYEESIPVTRGGSSIDHELAAEEVVLQRESQELRRAAGREGLARSPTLQQRHNSAALPTPAARVLK